MNYMVKAIYENETKTYEGLDRPAAARMMFTAAEQGAKKIVIIGPDGSENVVDVVHVEVE